MKPKTYILQKDLPDGAAKGDEYEKSGDRYFNKRLSASKSPVIEHNAYFTWQVEDVPEWFKLKEEEREKIQISSSIYKCGMTGKTIFNYQINLSKCLRDDTVSKIQEAIQKIVNDD